MESVNHAAMQRVSGNLAASQRIARSSVLYQCRQHGMHRKSFAPPGYPERRSSEIRLPPMFSPELAPLFPSSPLGLVRAERDCPEEPFSGNRTPANVRISGSQRPLTAKPSGGSGSTPAGQGSVAAQSRTAGHCPTGPSFLCVRAESAHRPEQRARKWAFPHP
jgi:hypothetical protein